MNAQAPPDARRRRGSEGTPEAARLYALFAAGWLLFDYPLLSLWEHDATLLGVPLLPAALFIGWAAIIAVLAWLAERPEG